MPRAVITGATGMIGKHLIDDLVENGYDVVALVRGDSPRSKFIKELFQVSLVECSLDDLPSIIERVKSGEVEELKRPVDVFFHLAWRGTRGDRRDNFDLQMSNIDSALYAARLANTLGCEVFVGVGSQAEYGRISGTVSPNTPANPQSAYGAAKLSAGCITRAYCAQWGIRHVWARVLSVYGPWDAPDTMISSMCTSLLAGEQPQLTACEQKWDYLYAADAARALRLLAQKGCDGSTYCIGSGQARPLRQYVEIIRDQIDPDAPLGIGSKPYSDKQVMFLEADISNLTADTEFVPEVSFDEGVRLTLAWMTSGR